MEQEGSGVSALLPQGVLDLGTLSPGIAISQALSERSS